MTTVIAIPSKDRSKTLEAFLKKHYTADYKFVISIEKQDVEKYRYLFTQYPDIEFLFTDNDRGLGYCRKILTEYAIKNNYKFFLQTDDNAKWDVSKLGEFISAIDADDNIWWLGGYNPIYDLFFNLKGKPIGTYNVQFANAVFILRVDKLKEINFDEKSFYQDDNELNMRFKCAAYPKNPIFTYKGFKFSKKRHEIGGATDFKKRDKIVEICKYLNDKFGKELYSVAEKRCDVRVSWKKYDDFLKSKLDSSGASK
jgi:hypothetical protein